jgi:hypothetical protein
MDVSKYKARIPYFSEYYEKNKERKKEYQKEYRKNNKDKINEDQRKRREDNKEYFCKYREVNKDKFNQYQKTKITCSCGAVISRRYKSVHCKTNKHILKTTPII